MRKTELRRLVVMKEGRAIKEAKRLPTSPNKLIKWVSRCSWQLCKQENSKKAIAK